MKLLVSGLLGHMGQTVAELAAQGYRDAQVVAGVDRAALADCAAPIPCAPDFAHACADVDCIIDFSHHSCTQELLRFAKANRLPLVLCTTGQTEEERAAILTASVDIPLFFSANMSLGVALLIELAKKTAAALPEAEIEIIERHHDRKLDAPSGTALAIADALKTVRRDAQVNLGRSGHGKRQPNEIGIHAIRMGNIVGEHEVILGTPNQTITLKHEAHSRALFAEGALAAAQFLIGKAPGLYDMTSMTKL